MTETKNPILEIVTILEAAGINHYALITASNEGFTKSIRSIGGVEAAILFTAVSMAQQELLSVISTNNKGENFGNAQVSDDTNPLN
jgi:hypothetical protein